MRMKMCGIRLAWLCFGTAVHGAVQPNELFSDYAVLQQGMNVPVWGTAASGEEITVAFAGQKKSAKTGADGKWMVRLDAMPANAEPRLLTISSVGKSIAVSNVLVGEVWFGSGQSNMQQGSGGYEKGDAVLAKMIADAPYAALRLRTGKKWQVASPAAIRGFSALMFSFGQSLQHELNVPVGLIVSAVGGTPSGLWVSQEAFDGDSACKKAIANNASTHDYPVALQKYETDLENWNKADAAAKAKGEKGARGAPPTKPLRSGEFGHCVYYDGPPGTERIGALYEFHVRDKAPYAIRGVLWDQGESGTGIEGVDQYTLMGALIRDWRKDWGQGDFPFIHIQKPNGGGPAWDTNDPVTARAEAFTNLPPQVPVAFPGRDLHIRIANYSNAFIVTTSDLRRDPAPHPANKSGYGARACRVALGAVYGKGVEYEGPLYQSYEIKGRQAIIRFTHVGHGLAFKGGDKLQGFAIAGADKKFVWGDAVIEGDTVVVSSDKVPKPVAVRYAYANSHRWANLFNKDGLPALEFHTDEVPAEPMGGL